MIKDSNILLSKHASGRWVKKVGGKHRYLAKIADDPSGDISRGTFLRNMDYWKRGMEPPTDQPIITFRSLVNKVIHEKTLKVQSGLLSDATLFDIKRTSLFAVEQLGDVDVSQLGPDQFSKLMSALCERNQSPHQRRKYVGQVKSFFSWGEKNIPNFPRVLFGSHFESPAKHVRDAHSHAKGDRTISHLEFSSLLAAATPAMRGMLFLGIQAGLGGTDLSNLKWEQIRGDWLFAPRSKTGSARKIPLLPETLEALNALPLDNEYVFVRKNGSTYQDVNGKSYGVSGEFARTRAKAGVSGVQFYDLRRSFIVLAEEHGCVDGAAIRSIMGHAGGISGVYRTRMHDARLRSVVQCIQAWLIGGDK